MSVIFTLIYIPCLSIFVYCGNEEHKNGELDMLDFAI